MPYGYVTPDGGFTIELWFKRDALGSTVQTLINQRTQASVSWTMGGQNGYGRQLLVELTSGGALSIQMINEGVSSGTTVLSWTDGSPSGYANDNEWHFIALRLDSNKQGWALFLDGNGSIGSGNTSSPVNWNPGILTFGAQYAPHMGDNGSYLWDKWLAYIAVYDKYLYSSQILEHYTAGSGGTVYYGDDEVTRLTRIANWADVPEQSRDFETAVVNLQGIQVAGTNALAAMQDTITAASGTLFADGQSRLVYQNRRHRYNRWSIATLAESTQSAPEYGITFSADDSHIYNDVRGDRPFGSTVRLVDDISRSAHGRKVYSFSLPVTTQEELENAVSWVIQQYHNPIVRVSEVSFRAESSDLIEWIATGGVNIGDHITLDELPAESAPESKMEFTVDKIALDVDVKNRTWIVKLSLTPFYLNNVFVVGQSNLGSVYKIAY